MKKYAPEYGFLQPTIENNAKFRAVGTAEIKDRISARQLLKRPEVSVSSLKQLGYTAVADRSDVLDRLKFRQNTKDISKRPRTSRCLFKKRGDADTQSFEYDHVGGLSTEVIEKLTRIRPETLGQALRIQE